MTFRRKLTIGLFLATLPLGCGDTTPEGPKPGEKPAFTEQQKQEIKAADEKIDNSEQANTPKATPAKAK